MAASGNRRQHQRRRRRLIPQLIHGFGFEADLLARYNSPWEADARPETLAEAFKAYLEDALEIKVVKGGRPRKA